MANNTIIEAPIPAVCCAGDHYVICIYTPREALLRILIGDDVYTCDDNGVRISGQPVQKFDIPRAVLDGHGAYTLEYAFVNKRKPYFTQLCKPVSTPYRFFPAGKKEILRIAHLSDVHGRGERAIEAGSYFGDELDLLILNGDISSSSDTVEEVALPIRIANAVTRGEKPCILTRGNHDLRGTLADKLSAFYPTDGGRTYYTVDLPGYSFIVLDCGEDKNDDNAEYGGTAAFHGFRLRETAFLQRLAGTKDAPFAENRKIVLAHVPFMYRDKDPKFRIEQDVYKEWCELCRGMRPIFGLFGHVHKTAVFPAGDPFDALGFGSPIILGGRPKPAPFSDDVEATFLTLHDGRAEIVFADASGRAGTAAEIRYE